MLWIGITLGCLALLLLQHLTGGNWGFVIRRPLEAATRNLPLMALLFVPILFGLGHLYEWAHAAEVAADPVLRHKASYLAPKWFILRAAVYFVAWIALGYFLDRWSGEQDRVSSAQREGMALRFQRIGGAGLIIYGLTVTFAAVDWVMSLDPHWMSHIFGLLIMIGQVLAAMAFMIVVISMLVRYKPVSEIVTADHLHDLGKLMLAFVMVWAYFHYSQFLIIWAGNLPEEIPWYLERTHGGYRVVALALIVFHFALPFVLLLSRDLKRNARKLGMIATLLVAMRYLDLFWLIAPNHVPGAGRNAALGFSWMDLAAPLAIGGIWLWLFFRNLASRPLVPLNDPLYERLVLHEHAR